MPPSSEGSDPQPQPASTLPYTPLEVTARIYSTAAGISVSCSAVWVSVNGIVTSGPNGITAQAMNAGIDAMIGARVYTTLSADRTRMSSLKASLMPSARLCSSPNGPHTLGPMRCCIRATTRRSNQILNSVSRTKITKTKTALSRTTQPESLPKRSLIAISFNAVALDIVCAGDIANVIGGPVLLGHIRLRRGRQNVRGLQPDDVPVIGLQQTAQRPAGRIGGRPHDAIGHVDGQRGPRDAPGLGRQLTHVPGLNPGGGQGRLARPDHRGAGRGLIGGHAVLTASVVDLLAPRGQDHMAVRHRSGLDRDGGRLTAAARPRPDLVELGTHVVCGT